MNAPLPLKVTREAPFQVYDAVASASNEVAGKLAARLAAETQGEVLFSPADRGRYATDASIYQVVPVGVFVPRHADEVKIAIDICRDLKVPIVARGGGTSQCGQTVGAGLVIDHSKHVRSILSFDAEKRTALVEPGIVLDHLNLGLKKAGLWYPVDVSTSAQATLGGMAGNNSCGSRSIAYGNMVHNVLGAQAWTADGALHEFGRFEQSTGVAREIGERVRQLAIELAPEIDASWPKVLRRVAGYNLDIFRNQSERPYTGDGSVNLAHLLIGSEGTLALTRSLTLQRKSIPPHVEAVVMHALSKLPADRFTTAAEFGKALGGRRSGQRRGNADGRRTGRPHHDRPGAAEPGLRAGGAHGADRLAAGDPAG